MKRATQQLNCILFNSITGLSELLWLFTTKQPYSELIFLLVIVGLFLTLSTLSIIESTDHIKRFYLKLGIGFILNLIAFFLLLLF